MPHHGPIDPDLEAFLDVLGGPDAVGLARRGTLGARKLDLIGRLFRKARDPAARRAAGVHYTDEAGVRKVIGPLFLDDLRAELSGALADRPVRRAERTRALHERIARMRFLDPACGCGVFLLVAYREMRRLEIEILAERLREPRSPTDAASLPRVNAGQFHGIDTDASACEVARIGMALAENLQDREIVRALGEPIRQRPSAEAARIRCGNALRLPWESLLPPTDDTIVMGNPPFVGKKARSPDQSVDMDAVWGDVRGGRRLDYAACWYRRAAEYVRGTRARCGFLSTSSLVQGEQVSVLWDWMVGEAQAHIHFAHRPFAWRGEARGGADVSVVVVGFGAFDVERKPLFDGMRRDTVSNVGPYLVAGSDHAVRTRKRPLGPVPVARFGSMPNDGGNLLFEDGQKAELLEAEPQARPLFRPFLSAHGYLHGEKRWCLWLVDADEALLDRCPGVRNRIEAVRAFRLASRRAATRRLAVVPGRFGEIRQPVSDYVLIPRHSLERRDYVPFSILGPSSIVGDSCIAVPDATRFSFGVLQSAMHMAWMRHVCGRLEQRLRYSVELVYNNFPWPEVAGGTREFEAVEEASRLVLAVREASGSSAGSVALATLYDPSTMPPTLAKAHQALDRAVDRCYRTAPFADERARVGHLFARYEEKSGNRKRMAKLTP